MLPHLTDVDSEIQATAELAQRGRAGSEICPSGSAVCVRTMGWGRVGAWEKGTCLSDGAGVEMGEGQRLFCLTPYHLTSTMSLPREKAPKEKTSQPARQQPRQGPTNEAQMAAAAALARLEQKQPRARGPTSQDLIRNQGDLRCPWVAVGGGEWRWSEASAPSFLRPVHRPVLGPG